MQPRTPRRYRSLVKQSITWVAVYTFIVTSVCAYIAQEMIEGINTAHSSYSRGVLDLAESSNFPIRLGTFFQYYLNDSIQKLVPCMLLLAAGIIIILFRNERKLVTATGLSALPYTKKERFNIHFLMGLGTLTFGYMVFSGIAIYQFSSNNAWITERNNLSTAHELFSQYETMSAVVITCALGYLALFFGYLILLFAMSAMGRLVFSQAVGFILLFTPLSFCSLLGLFIDNDETMSMIKSFLCPTTLFEPVNTTAFVTNLETNALVISHPLALVKFAIYAVLSFFLFKAIHKVYGENEVYRIKFLFMIDHDNVLSKYFVPVITITTSICGAFLSHTFINGEPVFFLSIAALSGVMAMLLSSRLVALDKQ